MQNVEFDITAPLVKMNVKTKSQKNFKIKMRPFNRVQMSI